MLKTVEGSDPGPLSSAVAVHVRQKWSGQVYQPAINPKS